MKNQELLSDLVSVARFLIAIWRCSIAGFLVGVGIVMIFLRWLLDTFYNLSWKTRILTVMLVRYERPTNKESFKNTNSNTRSHSGHHWRLCHGGDGGEGGHSGHSGHSRGSGGSRHSRDSLEELRAQLGEGSQEVRQEGGGEHGGETDQQQDHGLQNRPTCDLRHCSRSFIQTHLGHPGRRYKWVLRGGG